MASYIPWTPPDPSYLSPGTDAAPRPEIAAVGAQLAGDALVAVWRHPGGSAAYLTRITVQADTSCRAYIYVGERAAYNLVSGTNSGDFDENDPSQPYFVPEGTQVTIVWTSTIGAALARLEYVSA